MASYGGVTAAYEAFGSRSEHASWRTVVVTLGLWLAAILALSFESLGVALVLFGIAGLLIGHA